VKAAPVVVDQDDLMAELMSTALELIPSLRDYGPDRAETLLGHLSAGHLYRLVILLAAMVPDDRPVSELLAWLDKPAQSSDYEPGRRKTLACPHDDCRELVLQTSLPRHIRNAHSGLQSVAS